MSTPNARRPATFYVAPLLTANDAFRVTAHGDGIASIELMDRLAVQADDPIVFDNLAVAAQRAAEFLRRRRTAN